MNEIYKMMRAQFPTAICLVLMLISADSSAHGGGLDSYGCHNHKAKGNYHCHQGKYASREFSPEQAMIQQVERDKLDAFEAASAKRRTFMTTS